MVGSEPLAKPRRIYGYDLARSLALAGMIAVHFSQTMSDGLEHPAWAATLLKALDGRAAALFVVLAGIGVTLLTHQALVSENPIEINSAKSSLIRRGIFLLILGYLNLAIFSGDILRVYGASFLIAAFLIRASGQCLLLTAVAFVAGFIALFAFFDYSEHWDWDTMTYHRLWTPSGIVRNLLYDGFRSVFPWTGFLLLGMWLGRIDLRDPLMNRRALMLSFAIVLLAEFISQFLVRHLRNTSERLDVDTVKALFGTESMPPLPLFLLSAGGAAVFVIACCVRIGANQRPVWWLWPLIATGQLALTWYVGHIVFGLGFVVLLGLQGSQALPVALGVGLLYFLIAVLISTVWKHFLSQGPLEALLRRVAKAK